MKSIVYPVALQSKQIARPVICFDFRKFKSIMMDDLDTISSDLEAIKKDYSLVNGISGELKFHVLNLYGNEFQFFFSPTKFVNPFTYYRLDVFGYSGKLLLFSKNLPIFLETRSNILDGLLVTLNKYHDGIVRCWKCGAEIEITEALKNNIDSKGFCNNCFMENF